MNRLEKSLEDIFLELTDNHESIENMETENSEDEFIEEKKEASDDDSNL